MPLVHISLLQGKSPQYLRQVADSVHQAMVDAFDVPPDDRFQKISQYDKGTLIADPLYLGGPRSADFVLIEITAGRARSTTTKESFYRRLAQCLKDSPGLRPEDLMIVITTTQRDEWSFGNGLATLLQITES
ncbi:MAG: tautomerase family protein [Deltaproteobacteria bacterium]|nr:tautomerase family protein [Deltaproteobacteria bacterium]